jgi:hypothetical protein
LYGARFQEKHEGVYVPRKEVNMWILSAIKEMIIYTVKEIASDRFAQCILVLTFFLLANLIIYRFKREKGGNHE